MRSRLGVALLCLSGACGSQSQHVPTGAPSDGASGSSTIESAGALDAPGSDTPGVATIIEDPTVVVEPSPDPPTRVLVPANQGTLDEDEVRVTIRAHREDVARCYQAALQQDPSLEGELVVRFIVGPEGEVAQVEVSQSTMGDEAVGVCIAAAMRGWRFAAPSPPGSSALVLYPYALSTQ